MGPTDHEKATQYIETKRNEAFFPRMWVIPCECVRILKYRCRVGKVDSVVLPIDFCLRWIPLEGHPRSVCTTVHRASKICARGLLAADILSFAGATDALDPNFL
jgi:hypothetical protein